MLVCCTTSRKRKGQHDTMVDIANKLLETTQKCTCLYFLCSYPLFWCALIPPSTYVPTPAALSRNPKKSILWNYEEGKSQTFYNMLYTRIHVTILIYVMPCMEGQQFQGILEAPSSVGLITVAFMGSKREGPYLGHFLNASSYKKKRIADILGRRTNIK